MAKDKLRFGVLGCAKIAINSVIPAIQQSEFGEAAAIASRSLDKAREAADQLGIPNAYGSYEELIADDSIDAVYIPLPNHLHKEWTIKAAKAGKHVICEKPFALNAQEAQEMVDACLDAGVMLAEGFMYRFHPRYEAVREVIESGEIGEIRGLFGAFTFNNSDQEDNVRFHRDMGGGSLFDVGCYPISAARLILGKEPEAATAQAFYSPLHDHVDMMVSGLIEFPDSVSLTFQCGMWAGNRNILQIVGTLGMIDIPNAYIGKSNEGSDFYVVKSGVSRVVEMPWTNQYILQTDDFAHSVLHGSPLRFPIDDAVCNMKVLDACLKSATERVRVAIT